MKIQFLVDYRGVLTNEAFYQLGEKAIFEDAPAQKLVSAGRAREIVEVPSKPTTTTKRTRKPRTRKKAAS